MSMPPRPTARLPLLRAVTSEEGHRVTTLELFFDLVYVFAFTQVSRLMAEQHDAVGILQGLVVLALLWWSWTSFSWLANQAHADEGVLRGAFVVAMVSVFVAALVVLEAYHDLEGGLFAPLVFVGAYLVARLTHVVVYIVAAGDDAVLRRQIILTFTSALIPSASALVVGALLGAPWQVWCWLLAIALDLAIVWMTSRAGGGWRVHSAAHVSERYGLVVILALGESIVAIGVGVAQLPISTPILVGAVCAIGIAVALWWSYFVRLARPVEHALARAQGAERAAIASDAFTYLHLALVAGVVLAALGVEDAMAHVEDAKPFGLFGAAALGGGVALFLAGTGFIVRRVTGDWRAVRLLGAAGVFAGVAVLAVVPPLVALVLVLLAVLALLVLEFLLGRRTAQAPSRRTSD